VSGPQLIKYLMSNGVMAALNQAVDFDTAALAADHFGFEAESEDAVAEQDKDNSPAAGRRKHPLIDLSNAAPGTLVPRPPIVAVLGHVDHGKTSLLDAVRKTKVAAGEAGGITQVISAYQVERNGRLITFIDTPGHAAFTAMRARGADVTDVAILVVAADDGVMPQTEEAIQHIHAAGVPIVVAMNKIDKEGVNPDRALQQLAERGVVAEQPYGGDVPVVRTSARTGEGIDELLESVLTVSDILVEPKADPNGRAVGTVIDSHLERGRGAIATLVVQNGTLRVGDNLVAGSAFGKVRALIDDTGKRVKEAGPSTPVVVTGLSDVLMAGEIFEVVETERGARSKAEQRGFAEKQRLAQPVRRITLADLAQNISDGEMKSLNLVLKAEANGSLEALRSQVTQIEDPTVKIKVVGEGVGRERIRRQPRGGHRRDRDRLQRASRRPCSRGRRGAGSRRPLLRRRLPGDR
jgi:translation initiation factor IF-2